MELALTGKSYKNDKYFIFVELKKFMGGYRLSFYFRDEIVLNKDYAPSLYHIAHWEMMRITDIFGPDSSVWNEW